MLNNLFKPLSIGSVTLPNRICFLAHRTNFAKRGRLTDRHIAYYSRRARGKCGLIIMGELSIHSGDQPWESMIEISHPDVIKDFHKLTDAVHEHGTIIFAQLNHYGFQSSGAITRKEIWGPSAVADIAFGETAKPMEPEDFEILIDAFSEAARIARAGGFDGLEIDMGPESLLRQFLSTLSNQRQDEYGGSLENRMRLPLKVLNCIRREVGEDFAIGIRLCADEKFWGAITIDESRQFAKRFIDEGLADFINVGVGTYYNLHLVLGSMHTPLGFTVDTTEKIKESASVPTMASYQINSPDMAEEILEQGRADFIGFVRPLICDPDFPDKARKGRQREIRYCVRDNKGCIGRVNRSRTIGCIQNPAVGNESAKKKSYPEPLTKKRVIVIGGGPAGLEAAIAARERGHEVTVYEKEKKVGGQINLAKKGVGRADLAKIIDYQVHELKRLGVTIKTGIEATPEILNENDPDVVIVATGSRPLPEPVSGRYGPPEVLNVPELLSGRFTTGEKVLFIDENGGHHATATVEWLADQGKKVDMFTSEPFIGIDLAVIGDLYLTRQRLLQKGVTFKSDIEVCEIIGNAVKARDIHTNNRFLFRGYETIILDMGDRADDQLYFQLKGHVKKLYRIGDCVAPRGIGMAIMEGQRVGERL